MLGMALLVLAFAAGSAPLPAHGAPFPAPGPRATGAIPIPTPRPAALAAAALARDPDARICTLIAESADQHGVPKHFFARLLWKESLFRPDAVSPVGAQGIAQFMPYTAAERGLEDPFDPAQAIPASAEFLSALRVQFGNFGLAAAAYNGGPDRVARWLARGGRLPWETIDYVRSITFRPVEWFRTREREVEPRPLAKDQDFHTACRALPKTRGRGVLSGGERMPWGVQVAAGISRAAAMKAGQRRKRQYAGILGGKPLGVYRSKRRMGARYAARIGAPSRQSAGQICATLKRAGGACVVVRN